MLHRNATRKKTTIERKGNFLISLVRKDNKFHLICYFFSWIFLLSLTYTHETYVSDKKSILLHSKIITCNFSSLVRLVCRYGRKLRWSNKKMYHKRTHRLIFMPSGRSREDHYKYLYTTHKKLRQISAFFLFDQIFLS